MERKWIALWMGLFLFTSVGLAETVKGNGHLVTKKVAVEDFESIKIGDGIRSESRWFGNNSKKDWAFQYSQKSGESTLEITIDENLFPLLRVKTKDGKLEILTDDIKLVPTKLLIKGSSSELKNVLINGSLDFVLTSELTSDELMLSIRGAGDLKMEYPVNLKTSEILISGAGDMYATMLTCNKIKVKISGAGDIQLKGTADEGEFGVSGAGDLSAFDFIVKKLKCSVSGAGDMEVNASEYLEASVSGVGDISYKGRAETSTHVSGMGSIHDAN